MDAIQAPIESTRQVERYHRFRCDADAYFSIVAS